MPTASIRLARSWKECGLNADMAFGAEFDPKRTSLPRMAQRGFSGTWFLAVFHTIQPSSRAFLLAACQA